MTRAIFTVLVLAILSVACRPVAAQDISDIAGPFGLPISSASVERYSKLLELDRDQRQTALQLYQGYRGALRQTIVETNEALKKVEEFEPTERANKGMETLDKFADKHREIEQCFFDDLKVILRSEQEAALARVLRARRREVQMRFAFVAGEGVDLIAVFDRIKATPAAGTELAAMLTEYEESLDHLMVEKQKLMRASLKRAFKIQKNGLPDFDLVSSIIGDLYSLGGRVRDTSRKYVRLMEPLMAEEARLALVNEVRSQTFPRVYAKTLPIKMIEAARDLPELTPSQADELKSIEESYTRDLEGANQRYAAAIESTQERFPKDFLAVMQLRNETSPDDPLVKARKEREELDQKTFAKLRTLLKPEVYQKLPQNDPDRARMPEFLPELRMKKEMKEITEDQ